MGNGNLEYRTRDDPAVARVQEHSILRAADVGHWGGKKYGMPLSHGREYSEEELWDNYTYFIKQAAPVAEEAGVMIGIHPDDPPAVHLAGIPRCIFSSFEGYKTRP